ncbi:MAG: XylR family transcriptional regulator [Chthoniobacteraceae bacterium]
MRKSKPASQNRARRKSASSRLAPKVALLFETPNAYSRGVLLGIGEYMAQHGPWRVHFAEHGAHDGPPRWLSDWDGDGIIIRSENRRIARRVASLAVPVVDMTPSRLLPAAPWVKADDAAVAALAAQHFLERDFQHFGFCGDARYRWSRSRHAQFAEILRQHGRECHGYKPARRPANGDAEADAIALWLQALPKPVAVFACYDGRGQQVLDGCRRAGLRVPEEVAVLGVDNDDVLCSLSPPPLSSIVLNARRAGSEAAALLETMMRGEKTNAEEHLIPPLEVATRQIPTFWRRTIPRWRGRWATSASTRWKASGSAMY